MRCGRQQSDRGAAMLATTYGVGELSAINGVMGAKAERSLIFHVVGMPSYQHQRVGKIAHHTLGDGVFGNFVDISELPRVAMRS
jgi:indolepyruvate decarboxylase